MKEDNEQQSAEFELFGFSVPIKNAVLGAAFTLVTGSAGAVWAAADFMNRLASQEEAVVEAVSMVEDLDSKLKSQLEIVDVKFGNLKENQTAKIADFSTRVSNVQQQLEDNDISGLQGKLAELGTNLKAIMEQQERLLTIQAQLTEVEKLVTELEVSVQKAEIATRDSGKISSKLEKIQKEIDDLWEGMDFLANPLGG